MYSECGLHITEITFHFSHFVTGFPVENLQGPRVEGKDKEKSEDKKTKEGPTDEAIFPNYYWGLGTWVDLSPS